MLETFIDFGTYKTRLGVFNTSSSSKDYFIEKKTQSNVNIEDINLHDFEKQIKELIQTTEKKINYHIKDLNVMLDLSNFSSIDVSLKKNYEGKNISLEDIQILLQESRQMFQENNKNNKIIHMIVKKFIFDDVEYFQIPNKDLNYNLLIVELKFICFSNNSWKKLEDLFNDNHLAISNIYCSSYVRSANYNQMFENYKKKIFLDIGYSKSTVTFFEDKRVLFFNILPVGGKHISQDISILLKINFNEAESLKKSLNKSDTIFENKSDENIKLESSDLSNQVIHARVDEIIKLNLANEYFSSFFQKKDESVLIFTGEGSRILNKNSIYLEEKFDFFNQISFLDEDSNLICESGFNFIKEKKFQDVNFQPKKPKNKGFFEKFFYFFK